MKYYTKAAMKAVAFSEKILFGGPDRIIISCWVNRTMVLAVEFSVSFEIIHPVRCSTAISMNLFPVLDDLNGPVKSIENVSNNPVAGACKLVWYVGRHFAC